MDTHFPPVESLTSLDYSSVAQTVLPLRVFSHEGASYNFNMLVSRILSSKDSEIFVTNYPNSEFVFEHLHQKRMVVESVQIHSDVKPLSGGYPMGSGLIFTADHPSFFKMTQQFHDYKLKDYQQWLKKKKEL